MQLFRLGSNNTAYISQKIIYASHRWRQLMKPKKSPVSYVVLAHSEQHLHSKKRKDPYGEHRCVGQIFSEGQVRIFYHSRVLERVN